MMCVQCKHTSEACKLSGFIADRPRLSATEMTVTVAYACILCAVADAFPVLSRGLPILINIPSLLPLDNTTLCLPP
jgi:hypothetical protein